MHLIFLQGCQRSGNHILVQWLRAFMPKSLFVENICYSLEEQFDNAMGGNSSPTFESQLQYVKSALSNAEGVSHAIVSYEHPGLLNEVQIDKITSLGAPLGVSSTSDLHILRDPFNWMASYAKLRAGYKQFGMSNQHHAHIGNIFENYSRFQSEYWSRWYRSFRLWRSANPAGKINYNKFVLDAGYRSDKANDLSLTWSSQKDSQAMQKEAKHGSSFSSGMKPTDITQRFNYMLPMFLAFPIPDYILQAAKENFPDVYKAYVTEMDNYGGSLSKFERGERGKI